MRGPFDWDQMRDTTGFGISAGFTIWAPAQVPAAESDRRLLSQVSNITRSGKVELEKQLVVLGQQVIAICTDGNHAQKAENQHGNGVSRDDQMNDQYHHVNELHDEIAQDGEDIVDKIKYGHDCSLLSRR
jgi:hypothetical protein